MGRTAQSQKDRRRGKLKSHLFSFPCLGVQPEGRRKVMLVISDGDDNQSHAYLADANKECQRAETSVYTISTNVSPSRDRGDDTLQKIADATGGRAFFPNRIEDMPVSFEQIQAERDEILADSKRRFSPEGKERWRKFISESVFSQLLETYNSFELCHFHSSEIGMKRRSKTITSVP